MTAGDIIQPGDVSRPAGEIPFIHLPERSAVFRERAARLRVLAQGRAMQDYLLFMAKVCEAQQAELDAFPQVPLPDERQISLCREHGMPPLSVQSWQRHPEGHLVLRRIAARVQYEAPVASQPMLARLQFMDGDKLERIAGAILSGRHFATDLAAAPFVAAALQVYWTHMATTLGAQAFGRGNTAGLCPACASPPVASIVRIGGVEQGARYLSCSLCETQWHMVRVKCSNCESTKGISYYAIEGKSPAIKAETCEECGAYLKIAYMEKDPYVDPVADDLATLTLDLMMDEAGKSRSGPNLFLLTV